MMKTSIYHTYENTFKTALVNLTGPNILHNVKPSNLNIYHSTTQQTSYSETNLKFPVEISG